MKNRRKKSRKTILQDATGQTNVTQEEVSKFSEQPKKDEKITLRFNERNEHNIDAINMQIDHWMDTAYAHALFCELICVWTFDSFIILSVPFEPRRHWAVFFIFLYLSFFRILLLQRIK